MESKLGQVVAVLGSQWGDEGKGKVVDMLSEDYTVCARFNGGSNAGHTIIVGGQKFAFHLLPSGILNMGSQCLIGNGCVLHLPTLFSELKQLRDKGVDYKGRLWVSDRAHIVFESHMTVDGLTEGELAEQKLGTTKRGIGPCYMEKANRSGARVSDLRHPDELAAKLRRIVRSAQRRFTFEYDVEAEIARYVEYAKELAPFVVDGVSWINERYAEGRKILLEGANAAMLDIDFGTYPFVTSSSPTVGGCLTGTGLSANKLSDVVGVVKAYTTRVGEGPFPTELLDACGDALRKEGREFGTTTGRPRRCGWLDVAVLRYSTMVNGYTYLNLTKLDVLSILDDIKIGVAYKLNGQRINYMPADLHELAAVEVEYETLPGWRSDISNCRTFADLPQNAQRYVSRIEELLHVPVRWIGTGPDRVDMIIKE